MDEQEAVRKKLREFIENAGKTQAEISRATGISPAAISQFLSGQYTGDNAGLADRVNKYIQQEHKKATAPALPPFAFTRAARKVYIAADYAYGHDEIAMVVGRAGVGKTMAVQEYMKDHAGVVYVVIRDCDNSINAACRRILKALDRKAKGTKSDLMDAVLDALGFAGRLLVLDEAQHLSEKALDNIRSLNDEGNIPMLLLGNPALYTHVSQEDELDQIHSRIGLTLAIDDRPLLSDIESIFRPFDLDGECIQALYSIACRKGGRGGLRHMIKKYREGMEKAAFQKEPLSVRHLMENEGGLR